MTTETKITQQRSGETRVEHGAHDVKAGFGGNDVSIQRMPHGGGGGVLISQNTQVQTVPGNTVVMTAPPHPPGPPTLPSVEEEATEEEATEEETIEDEEGESE